jgi:cytochrome b561
MAVRDSELRYGNVSIGFHWLIALLVIFNLAGGIYMGYLPRADPSKAMILMLHKSTGLTILTLSVLRLVWRLMNPWQPLPLDMLPALRAAARATHVLFYFFIIAIPLSGWAMISASPHNNPLAWFGWFNWPKIWFLTALPLDQKKPITGILDETHQLLAYFAIALIVLHVGAAFYHHYVRRDRILRRMVAG